MMFLAYFQPIDPSAFEPNQFGSGPPHWIQAVFLTTWFAPIVPLFVAGLALMGMRLIPVTLAVTLGAVSIAAGLFVTVASSAFSLGSDTELLHGVSLSIAVGSSFLIWSGDKGKPRPSRFAKLGILVTTVTALWSLSTVPMILTQARHIAAGSPFCIAHHAPNSPIEALHELRGFSFYTVSTGYKSTSEWYFHGLMIADHPEEQRVYNWSPRRWRFNLVERPDTLIEPVRNACVPT